MLFHRRSFAAILPGLRVRVVLHVLLPHADVFVRREMCAFPETSLADVTASQRHLRVHSGAERGNQYVLLVNFEILDLAPKRA